MLDQNTTSNQQVYGFLCQQTNVFYAFDSYETYQQFLAWMESQAREGQDEAASAGQMRAEAEMDEEQQLADCQMATKQILSVFDDPFFQLRDNQAEMREIDF